MLPSHDFVPHRNGFDHGVLGPVANALALDNNVEESFGAEVSHVPGGRFHDGAS